MDEEQEVDGAAGEIEETVEAVAEAVEDAAPKWSEAAERAKQTFGAAAAELGETVKEQPLAALALVAGVAFALGFLARR